MSKIICDVCGTAYPETAAQCPICGCARPGSAKTVAGNNTDGGESSGYTFVKGGRFSKKNVRKRNKEIQARQAQGASMSAGDERSTRSNKGLTIVMLILLAAVIVVVIYIALRFFVPAIDPSTPTTDGTTESTSPSTDATTDPTDNTTDPTTDPTQLQIPCTGIYGPNEQPRLNAVGQTYQMEITVEPADTTDTLVFTTSDPSIATVTSDGLITAVGHGTAVITVSCGDVSSSYSVICNTDPSDVPSTDPSTEPSTEPTDPSTEPTEPVIELVLNREDFSLFAPGETHRLYTGSIALTQITWSSDDESVATFDGGVVTAVGPGETKVYAEYEGVIVSCIVRCKWTATDPTEPTDPEETEPSTEPPTPSEDETYYLRIDGRVPSELYGADVTITVGSSFRLSLVNEQEQTMSVDWIASREGVVSISGNTITGVGRGYIQVYVTIGGVTYSCDVHVN